MAIKIKNVLVSQPPPESEKSPYLLLAKKYNLTIVFRKFFKVEGIPSKDFRQSKVNINDFTAVIFTSKNSIDNYFRICGEMRVTVSETLKYFCVSESIALYLQKYVVYRKRKIFHGKQTFLDLMELIKKHKTEKFLLPCSNLPTQNILKLMDTNKISYTKAIIYRTTSDDLSDININDFQMLVFFSPMGIKSLSINYPKFKQKDTIIAAFGVTTAKAVKSAGLILNIEAPTVKAPSMTMAIEQYLDKLNKLK